MLKPLSSSLNSFAKPRRYISELLPDKFSALTSRTRLKHKLTFGLAIIIKKKSRRCDVERSTKTQTSWSVVLSVSLLKVLGSEQIYCEPIVDFKKFIVVPDTKVLNDLTAYNFTRG